MLTIKISCLPESSEEELRALFTHIKDVVCSITELNIKDENGVMILFPSDMMQYGLGTSILIEVTRFRTDSDFHKDREMLAKKLVSIVSSKYIAAQVFCYVYGHYNGQYTEPFFFKNR